MVGEGWQHACPCPSVEIGSGLDGERRKLHRLLADPTAAVIAVEHKDRLARFGVEHVQTGARGDRALSVVLDPEESRDDLVEDMAEVLRSTCVRLYGRQQTDPNR